VLVSSIRPQTVGPESLPELTGLPRRFGGKQVLAAIGALAVVLLAYGVGRSSLGAETTLASREPSSAGRAPAATERVTTAAAPAQRLAVAVAAAPMEPAAPVAAKPAVASAPLRAVPPRPKAIVNQPGNVSRKAPAPAGKRYGRTRDEAFDVGY
jgi:hypothetical protein